MSKWLNPAVMAATFAVVSATSISASAPLRPTGEEFPEETAALVAATVALFEAVEAESDQMRAYPRFALKD